MSVEQCRTGGTRIVLVGERLKYRSFNGANKALPVLASCLARRGFTDVVQLDLERPDVTPDDLRREVSSASLIAFAGCMTPQWPELDASVRIAADQLSSLSRRDVPIVVGGYAAKNCADIAEMTPWIDAFFDGEGESAIVEIAQAAARGTFLQERERIRGLSFVAADRRFVSSLAPRTTDLDAIDQHFGFVHVPERHDMDILSIDGRPAKTAQLFTQRGCPWSCGFCNKSTEGNTVVWLSDEAFRDQLRALRAAGYEAIYLDVDTFTVNAARARRQAEILHEHGFVWGSNTRVDQIDGHLMEYFVAHGCRYMFCGVEHVDPAVTLAVEKFNGSPATRIERAIAYPGRVRSVYRAMASAGLPSSLFLILGLPKAVLDESGTRIERYVPATLDDDLAAIRFAVERCDPDFINFNLLRFMPGSTAADVPGQIAYTCVRPTGEAPVTAGHFLRRVASAKGYPRTDYHGVFRLCESVGEDQPRTTAVDAERIYRTFTGCVELINAKIARGGKQTGLFVDKQLLDEGLVRRAEDGSYTVAPLEAFEGLEDLGAGRAS